jgi:uncharacterized protein YndB with AHSA1/START domain
MTDPAKVSATGEQPAADAGRDAIEREIRIEAPPDRVFAFFVEPDQLVRWMGSSARLDPRPGGEFRVEYADGSVALGSFIAVERPRRVAFTWGWQDPNDPIRPGASTVDVTLTEADGGTLVHLRHSGLAGESRRTHETGWIYFLGRLAEAVGSVTELKKDADGT